MAQSDYALFYWIDEQEHIGSWISSGCPAEFMEDYTSSFEAIDPLSTQELARSGSRLVFLQSMTIGRRGIDDRWLNHLQQNNISDEAELVFWKDGIALAGLALFRAGGRPFYSRDLFDWEAMRSFFEQSLYTHETVRNRVLDRFLSQRCKCSIREREVINLMVTGATNAEIADYLGVGLATVKTHVLSIFDKLGVSSRNAVISLTHQVYLS